MSEPSTASKRSGEPEDSWQRELADVVRLHGLKALKEAILAFASGGPPSANATTEQFLKENWPELRQTLPPALPASLTLLADKGVTPTGGAVFTEFDRRLVLPRLRSVAYAAYSKPQLPLVLYGPYIGLRDSLGERSTLLAGNAAAGCIARVLLEHLASVPRIPTTTELIDSNPYPPLNANAIGLCCLGSSQLAGRGRRRKPQLLPTYQWDKFLAAMAKGSNIEVPRIPPSDGTGAKRLLLFGSARQTKARSSSGATSRMAETPVLDDAEDLAPQLFRVVHWLDKSRVFHSILLLPALATVDSTQGGTDDERLRDLIALRAAYVLDPYSPYVAGKLLTLLHNWSPPAIQKLYSMVLAETLDHFNQGLMVLTDTISTGTVLFNHWLVLARHNPAIRLRPAVEIATDTFEYLVETYPKDSGEKNVADALAKGHAARFHERRTNPFVVYTERIDGLEGGTSPTKRRGGRKPVS